MLKQVVDEDVNSQRQQLERVRRLIERTGNRDLAIVGIFEQPVRMGIHALSERETHEKWTIPRMQAHARVLGLELEVSPRRDDGMVTVSVLGGA